MIPRSKLGLAGLLAFEAIIAAYTFGNGNVPFSLMYAIGALTLGLAVWRGPARWHFVVLALASGYRAWLQTAGGAALGVYPTWLVPIGFAYLAIWPHAMPKLGIASVAVSRTWFILWYWTIGPLWVIVAANVLGAAGAWIWAAAEEPTAGALTDAAPQPR